MPRYDISKCEPKCMQILGFSVSFGDEAISVIGRRIGHSDHRRAVETGNQDADVVVHGQAVRAKDAAHPTLPQPIFGNALQSSKNSLIIHCFEQAEIAGLVAVGLEMQVINLRTYAPNRCAVAPCQPKTGFAMIEERVPTPIEQPMHVAAQRWNPAWIIAMEAIGQVDKANAVAPVAERGHRNTASLCRRP